MIYTIIRYLYYGLFILTPLVMSSQTSELFEFNKMLLIYTIALIIVCLWVYAIITQGGRIRFYPVLIIPFVVFLLSQFAATAFSIDVHTSLYGYYSRFNGGLLSIITYMSLFFVFIQVFEKKLVPTVLHISVITSTAVVLWGLPGWFGSDLSCWLFTGDWTNTCWTNQFRPAERMFSTLGQPNWLGAYLVIHLCFGLWFTFRSVSVWNYIYGGYTLLMFAGILFTRSRSALLAAVICLITAITFLSVVLWGKWKKSSGPVQRSMISVLGVVVFGLIALLFLIRTDIGAIDAVLNFGREPARPATETIRPAEQENQRQPEATETDAPLKQTVTDSSDIRLIVWQGAIELGKRYPVLGTGVETFAYAYYQTRPAAHNMTSEWDFIYNKAHNEYLNYFATTGLVGLVSYLGMIGSVFVAGGIAIRSSWVKQSVRSFHDVTSFIGSMKPADFLVGSLILAYGSILITNFFGFSVTSVNIFFYLIPAIIALYLPEKYRNQSIEVDVLPTPVRVTLVLVLGAFCLYTVFAIYQYRSADITYAQAEAFTSAQQYDRAIELYEQALDKRYEHVYLDDMASLLSQYALLIGSENEESRSTTETLVEYALRYGAQSLQASPENPLYWKSQARSQYLAYYALDEVSYLEEGISSLDVAYSLAPTDPRILHSLGLFHSIMASEYDEGEQKEENQQNSLTALDTAIDLKPNYRDAYVLKGQLLAEYDRPEEARKMFEFVLENIAPEDAEAREELERL